jgi:hypothetical protein
MWSTLRSHPSETLADFDWSEFDGDVGWKDNVTKPGAGGARLRTSTREHQNSRRAARVQTRWAPPSTVAGRGGVWSENAILALVARGHGGVPRTGTIHDMRAYLEEISVETEDGVCDARGVGACLNAVDTAEGTAACMLVGGPTNK